MFTPTRRLGGRLSRTPSLLTSSCATFSWKSHFATEEGRRPQERKGRTIEEMLEQLQLKYKGKSKWDLDTPCLILDKQKFERNLRTMQEHVNKNGKSLRPHAKTHKCSRVALEQIKAGAIGISCAKVGEAEVLIENGVRNVLITSPVVTTQKIEALLGCRTKDEGLIVVVDNRENVVQLNDAVDRFFGSSSNEKLKVLVDVDGGQKRTGVPFDQAYEFGLFVGDSARHPRLQFCGIQCYMGNVQHITPFEDRKEASCSALLKAQELVIKLRDAGLPCQIFTGSGTGTWDIDVTIKELTEMQTGSYVMMDAEYLNVGSASDSKRFDPLFQDPPMTLLTTVVSNNHLPAQVTVDAGLKALYCHGGIPEVLTHPQLKLKYAWAGDEHGTVTPAEDVLNSKEHIAEIAEKLRLGTVLEVIVSHCDPTVNLFDRIFLVEKEMVVDVWQIDCRGKSQ